MSNNSAVPVTSAQSRYPATVTSAQPMYPVTANSAQPMYSALPGVDLQPACPIQSLQAHARFQLPPPGINHPMATISQQPNTFKPTTLPSTVMENTVPTQDPSAATTDAITPEVSSADNPSEAMDVQSQSD